VARGTASVPPAGACDHRIRLYPIASPERDDRIAAAALQTLYQRLFPNAFNEMLNPPPAAVKFPDDRGRDRPAGAPRIAGRHGSLMATTLNSGLN
jgi:hypothetical protein